MRIFMLIMRIAAVIACLTSLYNWYLVHTGKLLLTRSEQQVCLLTIALLFITWFFSSLPRRK